MTWDSGHILMLTCKRIKMVDKGGCNINLWRQLLSLKNYVQKMFNTPSDRQKISYPPQIGKQMSNPSFSK